MKRFFSRLLARSLYGLICCQILMIAPATAEISKSMSIEGHAFELVLTENTELTSRLRFKQEPPVDGKHYRGHIEGHPDSWVRASFIDGTWQGLVSISGVSYILDLPTESVSNSSLHTAEAQINNLSATPVSSLEPRACGVQHGMSDLGPDIEHDEPASALRVASEVQFSSLCSNVINGTCLIAELEVVFDADFVSRFGNSNTAQNQAIALINTTEGYYLNDFDISFEALSVEFLTNNVSTETDASQLLNDLSSAKDNGTFGFLQNTRSLFHLVTGRDLDGGTAGIGFVNELCSTNAVGLTSLLNNFGGFPNIPLTGIVMAHELGHNFGADHDGELNACGPGFIMEAAVNSSTSQFSSCSIDEITAAIEDIANPQLCFNFPADAGIVASPGNPGSVASNAEFTTNYTVSTQNSFQAIPTLSVSGSAPASQGRFTSATLNGQGCSITNQGQNYTCSQPSPSASSTLVVNAIATGTSLNLTHTTALLGSNDIRDVIASNDELVTALTVVTNGELPAAPSGLVAEPDEGLEVNLSWQDNSNNETAFILERRLPGAAFTRLSELGVNVTSFSDTTVTAGNTYEYQVFASNTNGSSTPTAIAQVEIPESQEPPPVNNGNPVSSGGGGGGSMHWSLLLCLLGLAWRRMREHTGLPT